MSDYRDARLSLALTLLEQHESKIGKHPSLWSWSLRKEFRRALGEVMEAASETIQRAKSEQDNP